MTQPAPAARPIASDTHNGFTIEAYEIPGSADAWIEVRRGGQLAAEFNYPAYRIWTLLAHWCEDPLVTAECSTCGSTDRDGLSFCSNAWHVFGARPTTEEQL